jgi:hypothetical protein
MKNHKATANTSLPKRLHFPGLNILRQAQEGNLESFSLNLYFKLTEIAISASPKPLGASQRDIPK